ncbi:MAG: hypothetical protein PHD95_01370 [Candidatus ainarchaeum sp.]|nr:hypothetical protein [Candidatus ainarchaeum sp.]
MLDYWRTEDKLALGLIIFIVVMFVLAIVVPIINPTDLSPGQNCSSNEQCVSKRCIEINKQKICDKSKMGEKCKSGLDCLEGYCIESTCAPAPQIGQKCAAGVPLPENTKCVGNTVISKEWYCPTLGPLFYFIIGIFIFSIIGLLCGLGGYTVGGKEQYWLTVAGAFILSGAAIFAIIIGC